MIAAMPGGGCRAIRHDDRVTRSVWIRAAQLLSLLFLVGPIGDLADADVSGAQLVAIVLALAAFVVLYVLLLPPIQPLVRRGRHAVEGALALLAALACLTLVLGAPGSFALLLVYVVVAAGLLLRAWPAGVVTVVIAVAIAVGLALAGEGGSTVAAYTLTILGTGAAMIALGSATRTNRELQAARQEVASLAASEERLRIARDLHDLLGHTLSLIALKSELAAKLIATDPPRAQAELAEVQRVTRTALAEVRAAVHGYRQLAFADAVAGAREALSAAGIDCRIETAAPELPAEVESVLAWAVREASTNVVRHSGARTCAITLRAVPNEVALEVEDDGAGAAGRNGRGAGLAGLAERARRLHGTLEAGDRPEGGFRLRLELPLPPP
jgi:two-component system sensor histidine kinase DesK